MPDPSALLVAVGLATVLSAGAVRAPSPGPLDGPADVAPLCSEVPDIGVPADRFRDTPIYIGNDQPVAELRRWAGQQPGFQEAWIDRDHLGWVVLAFNQDADARQADLEREFPGVGAVAVQVDWTIQELERLQGAPLGGPPVELSAVDIRKGVVILGIGALEPDKVDLARRAWAGERVCIDGIDPATVPAPGPQPSGGDGWRLLGDARVGPPYRTGIAADQHAFEALWREAGMSEPAPEVDLDREVVIWFGAVYGSSCPGIRLDDVVVDPGAGLVHAVIVLAEPETICTADANGHAYLVALDRDRLPGPPFRVQLQADDPPPGATDEITRVDADLRVPGTTPAPGEVRTVEPPGRRQLARSGDFLEPGFPDQVLVDARCGLEWLAHLNGAWWRTEVPPGDPAWLPEPWRSAVDAGGMLEATVRLLTADDPANPDGRPRGEATVGGETVVYHATAEAPPGCP